MNVIIESGWKNILNDYFQKKEFKLLTDFIKKEYKEKTIYPHPKEIFNAFNITPFDMISVVIVGQDPYHNPRQAHGLCFSVRNGIIPPSLQNIFKEIKNDCSIQKNNINGNLTPWAKQGVLLLNSVLTVEKNKPASHRGIGWEIFTDYVITKISDKKEHCVFLLWGNYAKQKGLLIDRNKHCVLESSHPSPFSAHSGFFGNKHFSQTNNYLAQHNKKPILW